MHLCIYTRMCFSISSYICTCLYIHTRALTRTRSPGDATASAEPHLEEQEAVLRAGEFAGALRMRGDLGCFVGASGSSSGVGGRLAARGRGRRQRRRGRDEGAAPAARAGGGRAGRRPRGWRARAKELQREAPPVQGHPLAHCACGGHET